MNLKRVPYVIVNFEQIHTSLFRVQKTACASYHCCCCLDSRQCRKVKKKGIQSKFSTRQVFPSTLFCTFFFPFPPSTMSSTRWTGKNKEQSFAQTLCFFNCYCFMPQYVVSYFRWVFWFYASFNKCCWLTFIYPKRFVLFFMFLNTRFWLFLTQKHTHLGNWNKPEDFAYKFILIGSLVQ